MYDGVSLDRIQEAASCGCLVMLRTRVEPIDRDVALILSEDLSPKARSATLAQYAHEQIEDAKQINRTVLGRIPRYTVSVDGRQGAALETVRPNGTVYTEFELFDDVLLWIADQLEIHSPIRSGRFRAENTLFADGVETIPGKVLPNADEFVFVNLTPYARKIERGQSSQAPDGVFQVVATLARRRFGNIASISFGYRTPIGSSLVGGRRGNRASERNPAIIVRLPR